MATLVLRISGTAYQGDPQFTVKVDQTLVTGVFTTSASHDAGNYDDIVISGDFSAHPGSVEISFINDAYGGWGNDRNLYVQSLQIDGITIKGDSGVNAAGPNQNGEAQLFTNGSVTYNLSGVQWPSTAPLSTVQTTSVSTVVSPSTDTATTAKVVDTTITSTQSAATTPGSTPAVHTVIAHVSEDAYQGNAQFVVLVDGVQFGGIQTATTSHGSGQYQDISVSGALSSAPHQLSVAFINDAYGGWGSDRNLYVQSVSIDGVKINGDTGQNNAGADQYGEAQLFSNGSVTFDLSGVQLTSPPSTSTAIVQTPPTSTVVPPVVVSGTTTTTAVVAPPATSTVTTTPVVDPQTTTGAIVVSPPVDSTTTTTVPPVNPPVTATVATSTTTASTSVTSPTSTQHTVVARVSEDAFQGDAQFIVMVDGVQFGGVQTATASHGAGQFQDISVSGSLTAAPHDVSISFLNDAYSGWGLDRNLYVSSVTVDGATIAGSSATGAVIAQGAEAAFLTTGTGHFIVPTPATSSTVATTSTVAATSNPDHLSVRVSEDAWAGDAQFTVSVDGKQVGGTYTATSSQGSGETQVFDFTGNFQGAHSVAITFINDAYGGWNADRNLYVHSIELDGHVFTGDQAANSGGPNQYGMANLFSNGTATFDVSNSTSATTTPVSTQGLSLLGVNLAGAEFGAARPGSYGTDYTYPTHSEIDYYASKGMDVIRLPFLWERLQLAEGGNLDPTELARIDDVVHYAAQKGLSVILDPHDFGAGFGNVIGTSGTSNAIFADFWGKVASHFSSDSNVIFGLMNEPNQQSASAWLASANAAISAIRGAGATQEILVPGSYWDTASTWTTSDNAAVVGTGVVDPLHNFAFEVHQYLDANGTGTTSGVPSTSVGVDRLTAVTAWAEAHGAKLFLGEFGVTTDADSLTALDNMLSYMSAHSSVWQGGTYWAGGPWWGDSNIYGIEPKLVGTTLVDQPQMNILAHYAVTT